MADFDLFNGDADGIFSLLQLRAHEPRTAELETGTKRDIALFGRVADRAGEGDRVAALDIAMARNRAGLLRVLRAGATVFYCDHHQTGGVPDHPNLTAITDTARTTCTAFLIDGYLKGAHTDWAICGAFGDNFPTVADAMRARSGLDMPMERLRELGELVNYNAYGLEVDDLHIHPAALFRTLAQYSGPIRVLEAEAELVARLRDGLASDWMVAEGARELHASSRGRVLVLPAGAASSRIGGLLGNRLVSREPASAFAVLTELGETGGFRVSIRAPQKGSAGSAANLAARFGGGGRAAAAGIDRLEESALKSFVRAFEAAFD